MRRLTFLVLSWVSVLVGSQAAQAELVEYYIGRDLRTHIPTSGFGSGPYSGLPNPNFNRVTFLYAHTYGPPPAVPDFSINHYHSKGTYSYTGANLGPLTEVNDYNGTFGTSNILPESPANRDIRLAPGTGAFAGMLRTGLTNQVDFNNLRIKSVDSLASFAPLTSEHFLHNSSGGRWNGSMAGSNIWLHLSAITSGLTIRDEMGNVLMQNPGDMINLGDGSTIDFTPVFAVSDQVAPGSEHNAVFFLSDSGTGNGGGPWLDGGRFIVQVTAVPEPGPFVLLGIGVIAVGVWHYRKRSASRAPLAAA